MSIVGEADFRERDTSTEMPLTEAENQRLAQQRRMVREVRESRDIQGSCPGAPGCELGDRKTWMTPWLTRKGVTGPARFLSISGSKEGRGKDGRTMWRNRMRSHVLTDGRWQK